MRSSGTPRLPVLITLSALAVLPGHMFVPSLPSIAKDLEAEFVLVNAAIAVYAFATAFTHLLAGALSDRLGRKPVALVGLAVFTIASIGCSLASDIRVFLVCRMLQGTVIAAYAVSLAAISDTSDGQAASGRIGYVSSAWAVAPMIGPIVGGMLDSRFGWRANFVAFALLGLVGLYLVACHLSETNANRSGSFAVQLKGYGDLVRSDRFCAYVLCMACGLGTFYVFLGGAPLVATQLGEHSSAALGLYLGMVPAGFLIGSYVVGRASSRYASTTIILAGRTLTCVGMLIGLALVASGATHPIVFFGPCVAVGLGNGLTMPAATARVLSLYPGLAGTASGFAATLTVIGAGVMALVSGLVANPSNASVAVLGVMLVTSLLSLAAAISIARVEKETRPR